MFPKIDIGLDPADRKIPLNKIPNIPASQKHYEPPTVRYPVRKVGIPLQSRTMNPSLVDVFKAGGSSIKAVRYIGDRGRVYDPHMVSWIEPFKKYCNSVTHLDLVKVSVPMLDLILRARASKVENLRLSYSTCSPGHLHCVSKYCVGLRSLSLAIYQPVPKTLWVTVGPTLEELHIALPNELRRSSPPSFDVFSLNQMRATIKSIEDYCRAIRRISIYPLPRLLHDETRILLQSYGNQLQYARTKFCRMSPAIARNIAASCPNAAFDVMFMTRASVVQDLNFQTPRVVFGARVRSLLWMQPV